MKYMYSVCTSKYKVLEIDHTAVLQNILVVPPKN